VVDVSLLGTTNSSWKLYLCQGREEHERRQVSHGHCGMRLSHASHLNLSNWTNRSVKLRRQLVCEIGLLTRASGSVRWKQGGTEVLAALHGPLPALQRKAQADRAVVEVTLRPRFGLPGERRVKRCRMQHMAQLHMAAFRLRCRYRWGIDIRRMHAGNVEKLHETIVRQTVEACAVLSSLPQSTLSIVLQVCLPYPACWISRVSERTAQDMGMSRRA